MTESTQKSMELQDLFKEAGNDVKKMLSMINEMFAGESFDCGVCLEKRFVSIDPSCGHKICLVCCERIFLSESLRNRCPFCRKNIHENSFGLVEYAQLKIEFNALTDVSPGEIGAVAIAATAQNNHILMFYFIMQGWLNKNNILGQFEMACHIGNLEILRFLLKTAQIMHGTTIERFPDVKNCVYIAALAGRIQSVRFLLEKNFPLDNNLSDRMLSDVVRGGSLPLVELLVSRGAEVTAHNGLPLQTAALSGHLEIARFLIEKGADVNEVEDQGFSAIFMAAQEGHLEVVKYLHQSGANLNHLNSSQFNALIYAAERGSEEIVKYLVEEGSNVNQLSSFGGNALTFAASDGNFGIVKILVEANATLDNGELNNAVEYGHAEVVQFLVQSGSNLNHIDPNGYTPLVLAAFSGLTDILRFLINSGANVNLPAEGGETPLLSAVDQEMFEEVKMLVAAGANVNQADDSGATPIAVALEENYEEIGKFLLQTGAQIEQDSLSEAEKMRLQNWRK